MILDSEYNNNKPADKQYHINCKKYATNNTIHNIC